MVAVDQRMPALLTPTATQSLAVLTASARGGGGGGAWRSPCTGVEIEEHWLVPNFALMGALHALHRVHDGGGGRGGFNQAACGDDELQRARAAHARELEQARSAHTQ
eukprot:COSAG01_NODE_2498_length_7565_cov_341.465711_1_plen_106_part_10